MGRHANQGRAISERRLCGEKDLNADFPVCAFCQRIENHEYDALEWRDAVSFQPLNPVTSGHILVVSKRHIKDATEDPYLAGLVMGCASSLAKSLNGPCNIITSIGREATQTIFHLHVHVVPRRLNDGLTLPWTNQRGNYLGQL